MPLTFALVLAAASIGSMHTVAPDHWAPFAALARAERWSSWRTASITAVCGMGHVTVSVVLGLTAAFFGLELLEAFGRRLESVAGFLLVAFGVAYGLWGIHVSIRSRWHDHGDGRPHWHGEGHHDHRHPNHHHRHGGHSPLHGKATGPRMRPWTLFLLFSADPCVAVIPLMFAAAPLGWMSLAAVVVAYELATIGTMVALVLPARVAVNAVRAPWIDRYGHAVAGGVIASVGVLVAALGL